MSSENFVLFLSFPAGLEHIIIIVIIIIIIIIIICKFLILVPIVCLDCFISSFNLKFIESLFQVMIIIIIITIIIIIAVVFVIYSLRVFHISVRYWYFTEVWANLLKCPRLFSITQ